MADSATPYGSSPAIELHAGDSRAVVLLHGAQVVSWTARGREQLYLSPDADYRRGQAIRGGIPVCFPQFDLQGTLPKHGFARNLDWDVVSRSEEEGFAAVELALVDTAATRELWHRAFRATLTVELRGDSLEVMLGVANTGAMPLEFTGALHTYLALDDPDSATLAGLQGIEYRDHKTGQMAVDADASLGTQSIARTYRAPGRAVTLRDGSRSVGISQRAFENVVAWNPGSATTFPDLPPDGYRHFVCVEAAQVMQPVSVAPDAHWIGGQRLTVG